jgi:hypothetical protein
MSSKGFAARAQSAADQNVAGTLINSRGMNAGRVKSGRSSESNQGKGSRGWFECSLM